MSASPPASSEEPKQDGKSEESRGLPSADWKKLYSLVRPYLKGLFKATFMSLMVALVSLVVPLVAGNMVDVALGSQASAQLNLVVLFLLVLFALRGVLAYFETYWLRETGAQMIKDFRNLLFSHLLLLGPDFYEKRQVGEILSRMNSDLDKMRSSLTSQIPAGIQSILLFGSTLCILLYLHVTMTFFTLLIVPPVILMALFLGSRFHRLSKEERDALAGISSTAEEAFSGIATVQAFARRPFEMDRFDGKLGSLLEIQLRVARISGFLAGIMTFLGFSAFALVLWYGGGLIQKGELTPGEMTSFLLYSFSIAGAVGTLGGLYSGYKELAGASTRVFEILEHIPSIPVESGGHQSAVRGQLELRSVDFSYPSAGDELALSGLTVRIEQGQTLGLVGPSGAGKTTLFALLLRFFDPREGEILLDGVPLTQWSLDALRESIGWVPQDIFLFSGTVRENIAYGQPKATEEQIQEAARAAGAEQFIQALPNGYEQLLGPRGVRLSVGQRQRLAIARAFLKNPPILLLDEATSALDPESEEIVQQALERLMSNRTTLVIAHRLATARHADRILLLESGRILEEGDHEALFSKSELYRRYWHLQSLQQATPEAEVLQTS